MSSSCVAKHRFASVYTYYRQFQHLYIDPISHLIQYYTPNCRIVEEIFIKTQPSTNQTRMFTI